MSWQDWVIGAAVASFAIALVPALRASIKPPRLTCVLYAGLQWLIAATFVTMGPLWISAGGTGLAGLAWTVLLLQRRSA